MPDDGRTLGIEWSSGELWHQIFYLSIFPLGVGFNVGSPFLYVSIPAGAILFVVMRGRLQRVSDPSAELNVGISPTAIGQESDSPRV